MQTAGLRSGYGYTKLLSNVKAGSMDQLAVFLLCHGFDVRDEEQLTTIVNYLSNCNLIEDNVSTSQYMTILRFVIKQHS